MELSESTRHAIDVAHDNIYRFHLAQAEAEGILEVETCPGVVCTRFSRPIQRVGLYIPGGTAILPSTALMLGIPAKVAGCEKIIFATPPGPGGKIAPEVVYVAHKVGATHIVKAGGAQAVAALAYGTISVPKVDKICGPGNQYVTCAKMLVQNDSTAMVAIDMPAGPSEVLVIADKSSNPAFVASDLLSQAEHGPDSQSVLVTVGLEESKVQAILSEVEKQAKLLPRKDIVEKSLAHSFHLQVSTFAEAFAFSNDYAPEHLILQLDEPNRFLEEVQNAGSVFLGHYSPESCGDYASGTNHTLPTYGYARMYAGVSWSSFRKSITSQQLTPQGLQGLGPVVETLARVEGLEAHARAVSIRLDELKKLN
ncbi:trifunctional histidinol dehydrogenase [Entomophthora muscae]|uniref:Trifunctional histidinol dehydrogenase n=1 Tax=Entomophthora muscae TaxID=34485 RepID=A0ACC2T423_9FUNG|nr:trifunctional histidinol dehydrogenase [Entomophthora muscae]